MYTIEMHADDYALSQNTTEDILQCLHDGKLDSISVVTNMSCYEADAKRYQKECVNWDKQPLLTVHLNFMEGYSVADSSRVPHLVNEKGVLNVSWGKLLLWTYSPRNYKMIKQELKEEIKAQTEKFREYFGSDKILRFDGHQHTQMIPVVYNALIEVIEEQGYKTDYIRVTREPIVPYLKAVNLWKTYRPVNLVKNLLLNFFAPWLERKLRKMPQYMNYRPMNLWGVVMSGKMDFQRVNCLMSSMQKYAEKKNRHLEVIFHPGTALPGEMGEEFCNRDANEFYLSENRHVEFEAVMKLNVQQRRH